MHARKHRAHIATGILRDDESPDIHEYIGLFSGARRALYALASLHDTCRANSEAIECIEMHESASDSNEFPDLDVSRSSRDSTSTSYYDDQFDSLRVIRRLWSFEISNISSHSL